ncbi:MAG: hypothetical protein IKB25_00895, partial [Lentisphaeria bacterium]|nr:hypothetical protein [Lentisphaeria bacterium]
KQPLPKRKIFISFEKSVGNNQKCLRTLSTLRFLRTKMCFQISGFATVPFSPPQVTTFIGNRAFRKNILDIFFFQ